MIARHCSPAVTRNWMRLSNKFASREKNNNSERENLMKRISLILAFAMLAALTSAAQEKPKADGATGWDSNPMTGLRELSGVELAQIKRDSDFYPELNYKKHYTKLEVKGKEKVGSYETYVIEATSPEGSVEKLYFDVNTGLLVRHDGETENPQGKFTMETYLEDYKVVDGVKIPHTVKRVTPAMTMVTKFTEVKNNVEIDDAKFNKPSN